MNILQEIELAQMMATDIDKVYKKYTKSALQAQQERIDKIATEKYHGCTTPEELQSLYTYDEITLEEYDAGRDFFAEQETRKKQLSLVEQHRANLKELRDRWKGTAKELKDELDEMSGKQKDTRTYVEKLEAEERAERFANMK